MSDSSFDLGSSGASADAVARRLENDVIGWFTTVRPDGRPHVVPVWFLWWDNRILIMSEPDTVKTRNLDDNPAALLHLHTDHTGNGVVVINGTAAPSDRSSTDWLAEILDPYQAKYAEGMKALGMELDALAAQFSVVIELVPSSLTAW